MTKQYKDMIWIIIATLIEIVYVVAIVLCVVGDDDGYQWEFWKGYIIVMTISNIISAIVWFKYFHHIFFP